MAISKVIYKSSASATPEVWMDATTATAAAADIISPKTAMLADGVVTTGTGTGGGGVDVDDFIKNLWPSGAIVADEATTIPNYKFLGCTAITSFSSDSVTAVGLSTNNEGRSFLNCTGLTSVSLPSCTYIADRSFQGCTSLVSVNLPSLTSAGRSGTDAHYFDGCTSLQLLHLPELVTAGGVGPFWNIGSTSKLAVIVLPKLATLNGGSTFRAARCSAVDIGPNLTSLPNDCFYMGTYQSVILRSTTLVAASGTGTLYSVTGTTFYIPKVLYDHLGDGTEYDYKAATNWSTKESVISFA